MKRSDVIRTLEEYERISTTSFPIAAQRFMIRFEGGEIRDFPLRFSKYVKNWIIKLSSGDCDDPFLTAVFINLYNASLKNSPGALKDELGKQLLLDRDLTDVREGVNYRLMNVGRVFRRGDWNFLKVLILYGIIRPKETLTSSVESTHAILSGSFLSHIRLMSQENPQFNPFKFRFDYLRYRRSLKSFDADEKAKISREYKILKSLMRKVHDPSATALKCLNYYFQVIPDPFVTAREIGDVIEIPEIMHSIFVRKQHMDFRISYGRLFPESRVLQPRSLQHLSRCAAREHLCKYGLLPNVVQSLMIPKAIKEYLLVVNPEL